MSKRKEAAIGSVPVVTGDKVDFPLAPFTQQLPPDVTFCTMPCLTVSDAGKVMRHIEMAQERLWDYRGSIVEVRDIIVSASEEEDPETGEVREVRRLILIDKHGFGRQTPSAAARRSLYRQISRLAKAPFHRIPPYDPPLQVAVREGKSTDGNKGNWLHLVVMEDNGPNSEAAS